MARWAAVTPGPFNAPQPGGRPDGGDAAVKGRRSQRRLRNRRRAGQYSAMEKAVLLVLDRERCLPVGDTGTDGPGLGLHIAGPQRQAHDTGTRRGGADIDGLAEADFAFGAAITLHHLDADAGRTVGGRAQLQHAGHVRTVLVGVEADADLALVRRNVAALAVQADLEVTIDRARTDAGEAGIGHAAEINGDVAATGLHFAGRADHGGARTAEGRGQHWAAGAVAIEVVGGEAAIRRNHARTGLRGGLDQLDAELPTDQRDGGVGAEVDGMRVIGLDRAGVAEQADAHTGNAGLVDVGEAGHRSLLRGIDVLTGRAAAIPVVTTGDAVLLVDRHAEFLDHTAHRRAGQDHDLAHVHLHILGDETVDLDAAGGAGLLRQQRATEQGQPGLGRIGARRNLVINRAALIGTGAPLHQQAALVLFAAHVQAAALADHAHRLALLILDLRTERHAAAIGVAHLDQQCIALAGVEAQVADGTGERRDRLAGAFQFDVVGHALRVEGDGGEAVRRHVRHHRVAAAVHAQARGVADDGIARARRFDQHHGVAALRGEGEAARMHDHAAVAFSAE
ncbi:hypothetical protein G6F57_011410 [Rhizopus arrhizus]|nr:hypothetical protein G6F57_011410 [Rhizopus arrhizus]